MIKSLDSWTPRTGAPRIARLLLLATVVVGGLSFSARAAEEAKTSKPEVDPQSGFIIDENWQIVQAFCTVCHSSQLVIAQRGTRPTWESLIEWMQKSQGLWPLEPEIKDKILTYLAKNYPPGEASRRANLPAHLRPPNPYVSKAKAEFEAKRAKGELPSAPVLPVPAGS